MTNCLPETGYTIAAITYKWFCSACNAIGEQRLESYPGESVFRPSLPAGWTKAGEALFCPLHKVSVLVIVDGEVLKSDD